MGEAKRRGTYEQRKAQAIERAKAERLNRLEELRNRKPVVLTKREAKAISTMCIFAGMSFYSGEPIKYEKF